jgi:hypothetical protein
MIERGGGAGESGESGEERERDITNIERERKETGPFYGHQWVTGM